MIIIRSIIEIKLYLIVLSGSGIQLADTVYELSNDLICSCQNS